MQIKRLGSVILAVNDLDKSLKFYHEILGLPIRSQRRTWIDLGQQGATISLHPASLSAPHIGSSIDNGIVLGLTVGDIKSAVDELEVAIVRHNKVKLLIFQRKNITYYISVDRKIRSEELDQTILKIKKVI